MSRMVLSFRNKFLGIVVVIGAATAFGCSGTATNSGTDNSNIVKAQVSPSGLPKEAESTNNLPPQTTPSGKVPTDLADAGEFGENIYDYVKAKNWIKAGDKLAELKKVHAKLGSEKILIAELDTAVSNLEKAIASKDENSALPEANKITFIVAEMTAKYNPIVPVEVVKLDFYGRELEIWAAAKDEGKLKTTAQEIRQAWDAVKPKVIAKGGTKQADVFEKLVVTAEAAKTPADYDKVSKPILDEVDNLEKVFEK